MTKEEKLAYQSYLIGQILNAPFNDAIITYANNFNYLKDINIIIPHPDAKNYVNKFKNLNLKDIDVTYLFNSDTLYCLNQYSFISILQEKNYKLKIETIVSLDTQIQSYLYRNYTTHNNVPESITEVLKLTVKRRWLIDCLAYTMENALFNVDFLNSDIYRENTLAFEKYFYSNLKAKYRAKKILDYSKKLLDSEFSNYYRRQYKFFYLELLVMVDISLNFKNLSLYVKELHFAQYFHKNIGILSERELNLAKLYFMYGNKIKFFGKIQKGRTDLINSLKNMAWDIFHINNTINNLTKQTNKKADFTIPFFVTYDQRLKDIIPIYIMKAVAFNTQSLVKHICYVSDLLDPTIKYKYINAAAFLERQYTLKNKSDTEIIDILQLEIDKYEKKLSNH